MNAQHEAIFRKAMVSGRPQAILGVARAFHDMGDFTRANVLHERARTMTWIVGVNCNVGFGAMARGTPVKGTNGAVVPPGRYWLDVVSGHRQAFDDWKKGKPEVKVETTEDDTDSNMLFVIFSIPSTANNYGMPGVFFPTQVLGFPTIAGPTVQSKQDTGSVPDAETSTEVLSDITGAIGKALGSAGKGASEGLGISTTKLAMIGGGVIIALVLLNRLMMPRIPGLPI